MTRIDYLPRWVVRIYHLTVFSLLFTGFAQMPIFKRYYLADVPGFAWTADYYLNHRLHYILAALLLAFFTHVIIVYFTVWTARFKITPTGWISVGLWSGIIVTGLMRMGKNQPTIYFSPETVMWVDWLHLGLVVILGLFSAAMALGHRRLLARRRPKT